MSEKPLLTEDLPKKLQARIRQLEREIVARQAENAEVINQNLHQNDRLHELNKDLDLKVTQRTLQLKQMNLQLSTQAERLQMLAKAKDALTHMIVHDMKNPLTVILGSLKMMKSNIFGLTGPALEMAEKAHNHSQKLFSMIEQMLDISRMESGELQINLQPVDLVSLTAACLETMKSTLSDKALDFAWRPSQPSLQALVDASLIERVINNLLNNAIKYAPRGTIIETDLSEDKGCWLLRVANQGESIPETCQKKIFELFYRVESQDPAIRGTGLGLAFVKLVVDAHHGEAYVESPIPEFGNGARFYIRLPKVPA